MHVCNIFKEGELEEDSVVKESLTTAADGKRYKTRYYNLDVIISVGYEPARRGKCMNQCSLDGAQRNPGRMMTISRIPFHSIRAT